MTADVETSESAPGEVAPAMSRRIRWTLRGVVALWLVVLGLGLVFQSSALRDRAPWTLFVASAAQRALFTLFLLWVGFGGGPVWRRAALGFAFYAGTTLLALWPIVALLETSRLVAWLAFDAAAFACYVGLVFTLRRLGWRVTREPAPAASSRFALSELFVALALAACSLALLRAINAHEQTISEWHRNWARLGLTQDQVVASVIRLGASLLTLTLTLLAASDRPRPVGVIGLVVACYLVGLGHWFLAATVGMDWQARAYGGLYVAISLASLASLIALNIAGLRLESPFARRAACPNELAADDASARLEG